MKSTLPAMHLVRQFLLFAFTVVFLLTMIRAGYALWQFPLIEETNAFVPLFVQGLRFDLALVGIICFVPVVLGSILSVIGPLRTVAKFVVTLFLVAGLATILGLELITPWFIDTQGLRPDLPLLLEVSTPVDIVRTVIAEHLIPLVVAVVLCVLIVIAFWVRMELQRFLRYQVAAVAGLLCSVVGGGVCLLLVWSPMSLQQLPLGPGDALISVDTTVNELAMNTTYKFLYSIVLPFFN